MKIVIYGATEIGCLIATEFFEDHDITIIDKEENRAEELSNLDENLYVYNTNYNRCCGVVDNIPKTDLNTKVAIYIAFGMFMVFGIVFISVNSKLKKTINLL